MWTKKKEVRGEAPDFGAIFMSNKTTLQECLDSNLFGLPSFHVPFVKQVRSGMILFLYEYENRKLHGVFQATCDGDMNIVPHAYKSSGKLFPAQVRFTRIWDCHPLEEYEFRYAIEDNYYDTRKFNFGLSHDQVSRLLRLFNSRKREVGSFESLSCGRKRPRNYQCGDEEIETERTTFRRILSSGRTVVMSKQEGSSTCDYTDHTFYGSGSSEVSGVSCSSGECKAGSNDSSGSGPIVSEEEPGNLEDSSKDVGSGSGPEKEQENLEDYSKDVGSGNGPEKEQENLEDPSKDVGTELEDFIPLLSPDNSDSDVEYAVNNQTEYESFDNKGSSYIKSCLPLMLLRGENLRHENIGSFPTPSIGDCHLKEGTQKSLEVKSLYSYPQGKRSCVLSRLNFGSKDTGQDKDASTRENKLGPNLIFRKAFRDLQQSNEKRRNTNSHMSKASEVIKDNDDRVRSKIGSGSQKKTTNEAVFALGDKKDAPDYPGREEERKTRGHDSVQDIMDSLLQRHVTWKKLNAKDNSCKKENVNPIVKKSVFSRLSWVSGSADQHTVMIRSQKGNDEGNKTVMKTGVYVPGREGSVFSRLSWVSEPADRDTVLTKSQKGSDKGDKTEMRARVCVQEREGSYKGNKTVEELPETLQQHGLWKMARQSDVSNPNCGDEMDFEKSTHMGKMLKKQDQTDETDCIGDDSESKCEFEQGPRRKLAWQLFAKSSEVKTVTPGDSGSVQMPCEKNSAEFENSGSCEVPSTGHTADDKIDSFPEKEVEPVTHPLQCNGDKGEAACNLAEKESELEQQVDQFTADGGIVTTPLKTYIRRQQKAYVYSTSPTA